MELDTKPKLVPSLTGIRGVGALWVLLYHPQASAVVNHYLLKSNEIALIHYGWVGVDLFFLLSGFMLMHAHAHQLHTFAK